MASDSKLMVKIMGLDTPPKNKKTDELNFDEILNYELTQITEYQAVIQFTKTGLTKGPTRNEGNCDICDFNFAHLPTETWECGHVFCRICSQSWKDKHLGGATCPTCRRYTAKDESFPKL